ncbi:MAG: hypothetical protein WDZ51_12385 [Pirellulaceae bacterium]
MPAVLRAQETAKPLSAQARVTNYRQVDSYLQRLGLTDQRIILAERALEAGVPTGDRKELVETVADLYAARLLAIAEDSAESRRLLVKVGELLRNYPEADTPAIRVLLLQADYNRAEAAATRWINDPDQTESRDAARKILERIAPELVLRQGELLKQVDEKYEVLDRMPRGSQRDAREQEAKQLESVSGRAAFFGAWANYYLVVVKETTGSSSLTQEAIRLFQDLLSINPENLADIEPETLGLEQEWRARALIGLGLAEVMEGNTARAQQYFQWLRTGGTSHELADQADYWFVRGLLSAGKWQVALEYCRKLPAAFQTPSTPGKTSLAVMLADSGLRGGGNNDAVRQELGTLGLTALAKLGHHAAAIKLMEKYDVPLGANPDFYGLWLYGQRQFAAAEKSQEDEDYQQARQWLTKAIDHPEADADPASLGECRYTLAWCLYRLKQYAEAGNLFRDASLGLKAINPNKGAEAAWMSFVAYQSLATDEPRYALSAIDVLEQLKRDYPDHNYAKRADFFIAKLQQSRGSLTASIRQLQSVSADDPSYFTAQYDLCVLLRQQVDRAQSDAEKKSYAQQVREVADKLQGLIAQAGGKARLNQVAQATRGQLLVAELARLGHLDEALRDRYLSQAGSLVARLEDTEPTVAQFHYESLRQARDQGNQGKLTGHVDWLLKHGRGTNYETTALIIKAMEIDQRTAANPPSDDQVWQQGYDVYSRLAERLNFSAKTVASSNNTKVAGSKAAYFAEQTGRPDEAARLLRVLVEAFPNETEYLRRTGKVEFESNNFTAALPHFRKLLLGVPRDSEAWFEAKYYQLASLRQTDPPQAKKVLSQFQLLHSDWGNPVWRDRIKEVAAEISDGK